MTNSATQLPKPEHQGLQRATEPNNNLEIDDPVEYDSVPPTDYAITSYGADYPVDSLVQRMNRGDIFIPSFQRSYVWQLRQASRFIESLLMGLPVPSIVLAREMDSKKLMVVDGQQRLKTLQFFYAEQFPPLNKKFALENVAEQFLGKTYSTLSSNDQRTIDDFILPVTVVRQDELSENGSRLNSIYNIFERLNTGGTTLAPQEIRNSIYHGEFSRLLTELNQNISWQRVFQGKDSLEEIVVSERLKDQELILRFLGLYFDIENYRGSMEDFLSSFMESNRELSRYSRRDLQNTFLETIELVYRSIGSKAFRLVNGLNAAVFDAMMVGIANRIRERDVRDVDTVKQVYENLLDDQKFLSFGINNTHQVSHPDNVKGRVKMSIRAFQEFG
ncbi:MAG: DUF262 domain-containing protein [Cyanobacteria bacterium P01_G01_bin.54]